MIFRFIIHILVAAVITGWGGLAAAREGAPAFNEYQVKAAFLYNIAKFVEWPSDAFASASSPMNVCILGRDPFGAFLETIRNKAIKGRVIAIRHTSNLDQVDRNCQILFVSSSEKENVGVIVNHLRKLRILTVADMDKFSQHGGMITLIKVNDKIRFEINTTAAQHSGLKISSQLLKLAKEIHE